MKLKKLKNNWSPAHFLYYMTWFFRIGILIFAVISTITFAKYLSNGQVYIDQLPVKLDLGQEYEPGVFSYKNLVVNDIDSIAGKITLSGSDLDVQPVIIGLYLIKIFKLAMYFSILFLFGRIFKSIMDEEPFHDKNPKRFYIIGWILVLAFLVFKAYNYFFAQPFFEQFSSNQDLSIIHLNFYGYTFFYAGMFMIVLWYVFKEGARIYEEQKLTV